MRELVKSMISFSWAMSLFGPRRMGDVLASGGGDAQAAPLTAVAQAAAGQLDGFMKDAFQAGDDLQRRMVDALFEAMAPCPCDGRTQEVAAGAATGRPAAPSSNAPAPRRAAVRSGRLDRATFLVLGEGLAAGLGDFALSADSQRDSFPAQMAGQMGADFPQRLIQPPGIGQPPGCAELPMIVPGPMQTTFFESLPPVPPGNLSLPGLTLHDALNLRPVPPLIHRQDGKQCAVNLLWGAGPLAAGQEPPLPSQLEHAVQRRPTFAIVALGYCEVLEAAIRGDVRLLPEVAAFRADYAQLLSALRQTGSEVLALNVPDPLDTACFSTLDVAARIAKVEPGFLRTAYGLEATDLVTVSGLNEIGFQLFSRDVQPLPAGSALGGGTGQRISARVAELNAAIDALAREHGARAYDLHALFQRVRREGVTVGARTLTAEYLGGFYSLNGCYPGATGQAVIGNELLALLNRTYGAEFPPVDLQAVMRRDPVAAYRQAPGPCWTASQLASAAARPRPAAGSLGVTRAPQEPGRADSPPSGHSLGGESSLGTDHPIPSGPLRLPPGRSQVLPLSRAASYFGDGIAAQHCRDERGVQWGSCGSLLFGGLAIVDSHLAGRIRITFSEPEGALTRFQVSFLDGLVGDDAVLVTPQYFKMAFQQSRVDDVAGQVSSGVLNLETGEVSDLKVFARYSSTALMALVSVNPTFPRQPLSFPGPYGSAWAQFSPRADGALDFTFYGSAFVPLGRDIVWPLNFVGPAQQFATIPAHGTVMHPHLHLSTMDPPEPTAADAPPDIPFNAIQELTLHTHNSSFGDAFTLHAAELGGTAKGRSHVLGRVQLQFGARSGDSVPVAITHLDSGGLFNEMPPSPITMVFPGRLYHGPRGFNEFLRFPLKTYSLDDLTILDDPFDISMGLVDLRTGRFVNQLLHRGFINQDLIFALLRVEPRTPKDSFYFRGPARLVKGSDGRTVFRFRGVVRVPFPEGFFFPKPNLTGAITVGPDSVLDPFLWIRAVADDREARATKEGLGEGLVSSAGEVFSYRFRICPDPARPAAVFEYENHTQKGTFRLHSLSWAGLSNSLGAQSPPGEHDTLTFSGFGIWRKDGLDSPQQAAVQISTSRTAPYVAIQIGAGEVSDVNTKPEDERDAQP